MSLSFALGVVVLLAWIAVMAFVVVLGLLAITSDPAALDESQDAGHPVDFL